MNAIPKGTLYHKDVYLPNVQFAQNIPLRYSRHALQEAQNDKYGNVLHLLPQTYQPKREELIEIEILNGKICKAVFRLSIDAKRDLVLVIASPSFVVKTVWVNLKTDTFNRLNRSRYSTQKVAV